MAFLGELSVALLCLLIVYFLCVRDRKRLPPLATESMLTTIAAMTTSDAPWFVLSLAQKYPGRVFRMRVPQWRPWVVIADGPTARAVLRASAADKPSLYSNFDGVTAGWASFFTSPDGPRWAHARKGVSHAFTSSLIRDKLDALQSCAALGRRLDVLSASGEEFDAAQLMIELMIDVLGETVLAGFDFGMLRGGGDSSGMGLRFLEAVEPALIEYALKRTNNPLRKLMAFAIPEARAAGRAAVELMRIANEVMEEFRSRREAAASASEREELDATIIGKLVSNPNYAHEQERAADVVTFLIAGHDTTGFTLAWTLYELAAHPEIADRLAADLRSNNEVAPERSEYLAAVINESMRLWPVAAMGSLRVLAEDLALSDGAVIPAGAICSIPFLPVHRTAPVQDAGTFKPERWLKNVEPSLKENFMPFSTGRRNCVGQTLAMAELKRFLALIVTGYKLELVRPPKSDYFLTLKPADGRLRVSRRPPMSH